MLLIIEVRQIISLYDYLGRDSYLNEELNELKDEDIPLEQKINEEEGNTNKNLNKREEKEDYEQEEKEKENDEQEESEENEYANYNSDDDYERV